MRYVIAACPLTKIFITSKSLVDPETGKPESWQDRCMRDYQIIENVEEPFDFAIPGADGAIPFSYNIPQLLTPTANSSVEARFEIIAGGADGMRSPEYDIYGVVAYDLKHDIVAKMHELNMLRLQGGTKGEVKSKIDAITKAIDKETSVARDKAIKASYAKVQRAIARNHHYLETQWQKNMERGGSKYLPSITERLGAISIRDMISRQRAKKQNAMTEFSRIMEQTQGAQF